jgi:hypothetical protein
MVSISKVHNLRLEVFQVPEPLCLESGSSFFVVAFRTKLGKIIDRSARNRLMQSLRCRTGYRSPFQARD